MDMFGQTPSSSSYSGYTASAYDMFDTSTMGASGVIGYTVAILLIAIVLLLFVHYTIMPIFQLQPGGPGLIRIPFLKDNETFWIPDPKDNSVIDFSNCAVNSAGLKSGWSMSLDICIMNPLIFNYVPANSTTKGFRLIFNRGGRSATNPATDGSIASVITGYNVAIGLLPDTNDLQVSVMNANGIPENLVIKNVPTQRPFRIGVVVMDNAFEVYMNGKLVKTRTVTAGLPTVAMPTFQGPQGSSMNQMARVGNLLLWAHEVIPSVMKYAEPPLMPFVPATDTLNSSAGMCGTGSIVDDQGSLMPNLSGLDVSSMNTLRGIRNTQNTVNALESLGPSAINSQGLIASFF